MIESYEEFDYVRNRIAPRLEKLIEQSGFVVLQWSDAGWVRFFTKMPARTPDDIRKRKLFTSAGDPEGEKLYREFGPQVVPLAVTDMLPSLQTNMSKTTPRRALYSRPCGYFRSYCAFLSLP